MFDDTFRAQLRRSHLFLFLVNPKILVPSSLDGLLRFLDGLVQLSFRVEAFVCETFLRTTRQRILEASYRDVP